MVSILKRKLGDKKGIRKVETADFVLICEFVKGF